MKNFAALVLAALIILTHGAESDYLPGVGTSSPTQLYYNGQMITATKCTDYPLNAGNTFMHYGTVRVCNTRDDLYIGVYGDQGFIGTEAIKIWIGTSLALLPTPKNGGRPIAGKFPYKSPQFASTTYYWSFKIAFTAINRLNTDPIPSCSVPYLYIYVHADCSGNTCFGGSVCSGSGSVSAWYCSIIYVPQCPTIIVVPDCSASPKPPGCPTYSCDTAFAYGSHILANTFNPDNLPIADPSGSNRWGWAYKSLSTAHSITFNIYAGAGQNRISNGYLAGTATYTWNAAGTGTVVVNIPSDVYVGQYQIHISDSLPRSVSAPGSY